MIFDFCRGSKISVMQFQRARALVVHDCCSVCCLLLQAFLHSHNRPQLSLHEEMVRREKEREREEQHRQQAEVEASRLREEERVHGGTIPTIALTGTA